MPTYTVAMLNQTIVADATLVIIHSEATVSAAGSLLQVLRCGVSQNETETGQQLGVMVAQKASAFGTYTATTPAPHAIGGAASPITGGTAGAESTAGTDASAEGAGTVSPIFEEGFDNRNGWLYVPTVEERPILLPDTAIIVKIIGTPATLTGWNAFITFRDLT